MWGQQFTGFLKTISGSPKEPWLMLTLENNSVFSRGHIKRFKSEGQLQSLIRSNTLNRVEFQYICIISRSLEIATIVWHGLARKCLHHPLPSGAHLSIWLRWKQSSSEGTIASHFHVNPWDLKEKPLLLVKWNIHHRANNGA